MCHVKATGKCVVCFGVCVRHMFLSSKFTASDKNCVLMAYGEYSVSENGVESLKIVEHTFLVITALDTNSARVEEVIWKIDG